MKPQLSLLLPALLFATVLTITGYDSNDTNAQTFDGPEISIGNGTAHTFFRTNDRGEPEAIGIVLSEAALQGLPGNPSTTPHDLGNMHVMQLPAEALTHNILINHVSLDWNPQGHEPEGLFTLPHFDMHFYMVPEAERMTWMPTDPDFEQKGMRMPEARFIPQGFISPPGNGPIPMMGLHWLDGADPTYAPGGPAFTEVFLWGSYDGQIIFPEPMITKAFLEGKPNHSETLAQPEAFAKAGYYPTRYSIRYDAAKKEYVIALEGLTLRAAAS